MNMLGNAVEDTYTAAIKKEHMGYTGVTALKVLTHLFDTYTNIDNHNLQGNTHRLNKPFDPSLLIDTLFEQIVEMVAYADARNTPLTNQ